MKNILVISAHPDDLEMSCGGTVAKMIRKGDRVLNLVMYPDVEHVEHLPRASSILGFETLLYKSTERVQINNLVVAKIESMLVDFKPDIIITHWKEDWHQDHRACHELGNILARKQPVDLWYMSSYPYNLKYKEFSADLYVRLAWGDMDKKYEALEQYQNLSPIWLEGVSSHDHWRGSYLNSDTAGAEVFKIGNMVK